MATTENEKPPSTNGTAKNGDATGPPTQGTEELKMASEWFGIWEFYTIQQGRFDPKRRWEEAAAGFHLFRRLSREIFAIAPGMLVLFILSKLWTGIETAVLMHLSSRLLEIVEVGLREGRVDTEAVGMAMAARLACVAFVAGLQWWTDAAVPAVRKRIIDHYEMYLMKARLRLDLPTSQEPNTRARVSAWDAWNAFETVVEFFANILTSASQFTVMVHASRTSGGPIFALLCVAKPLIRTLTFQSMWSQACLISQNNEHYKRMQALRSLTGDSYKQDYISGNLGAHILSEYEKAQDQLGDTCTDEVWEQYDRRPSPYFEVGVSIIGDLPMVYCAMQAVMNPTRFSIASVAILQESASTLRWSFHSILYTAKTFQRQVATLKNLYALSEVKNKLQDGDLSYPPADAEKEKGMGFELRDVSFKYPGSKTTVNALDKVSVSIKPGQLVVIVGANGSGKSTIIKLLTRLYDPSEGSLLVDNVPAKQYRSFELRGAMATFTQDHSLYPLSLYENIALGYPEMAHDKAKVQEAAEQGGAADFIAKLENKMDTILDPMTDVWMMNVPDDSDHPLQKQKEKLEKKLDVSGGERQRLVASRTFMHLGSGKVKFVAVDEPSSALDPEAEWKLFDRLITGRGGKTMVFVTHRFGHLTKFADMIICMKGGKIEELGSHGELMKKDGEYAKLFKIQANAFTSKEGSKEGSSDS